MHTQFHINWIGKQWIIDQIALLCGLRTAVVTYVNGDRVERSKTHRRAVLLSLVDGGYLIRHPGEPQYLITEKAFGAIETGEDWTSGDLLVRAVVDGYGLRDLDVRFLKVALIDIRERRVSAYVQENGDFIIRLTSDTQTSNEQYAEQWVLDNLPALAHQLLDLSEASAQLVSLRGVTDLRLRELPTRIDELTDECCREINKLRMREEALLILTIRIDSRAGGWDKFIAECQAIQKLHVMGGASPLKTIALLKDAQTSANEAALADKLYKDDYGDERKDDTKSFDTGGN